MIPDYIKDILHTFETAGFEAFIVGGGVRDILCNKTPKDWDITTNATPDKIQELFPDSVYENDFGTVGIKRRTPTENAETVEIIEATPYRTESGYADNRRPSEVAFVSELSQDINRRDFTINALAMKSDGTVIDLVDGQADLKAKIIRTVGNPRERFGEDALRLLRAVRFAVQMDFEIEPETKAAMIELAPTLAKISVERIRDELTKMMMTPRAMQGYILLHETKLLPHIMPELEEGIQVMQNGHHIYDVWEHLLRTMQHAVDMDWDFDLRMAGLLHDVAKPRTKEGIAPNCSFHGHEVVGASMSYEILNRLRFPKKFTNRMSKLVRYHMFYYDTGEVTESSVRKLVRNVGVHNIKDLIKLRECDRIGSGTPKARPYRLRHFEYMAEKVMTDPITLSMLKIDGNILMKDLGIKPGPEIGMILNVLLAEVLEDASLNTRDQLITRVEELKLQDLRELKKQAITTIEAKQEEQDREIKRKYHVQ